MRPMLSSELMDLSLQIYQTLGRRVLSLTAGSTLVTTFAACFVGNVLVPRVFQTTSPGSVGTQLIEAGTVVVIALLVAIPLFLVGVSYSLAVVIQLVSDYMNGRIQTTENTVLSAVSSWKRLTVLNFWESLQSTSGLIISLVVLSVSALASEAGSPESQLVTGMIGVAGVVLGFLVYLLVISSHALAAPIVHLEGLSSRAAMKRSQYLLKRENQIPGGGQTIGSTFALLLLLMLIIPGGLTGVIEGVGIRSWVSSVLMGVPMREPIVAILDYAPVFLLLWTSIPIWGAMTTILYYERRIRKEGYDIEVLMQEANRGNEKVSYKL